MYLKDGKLIARETYDRGESLFEVSLSRVWTHGKKGFIMISAYRGDNQEKNNKNHDQLKKRLKKEKMGFFEIDGIYKYDDGHTESELSVFIPFNQKVMTLDEFKVFAKTLGKDFNQESVLLKLPDDEGGDAILVYQNKEISIGSKVGFDKIGDAYSKLRTGSHKDRSFVIEGVRIPSNHISAYGFKSEGILF